MFTASGARERIAFTLGRQNIWRSDSFNTMQATFPRPKQIGRGYLSHKKQLRLEVRRDGLSINSRDRKANGNGGYAIMQFRLKPLDWATRRRAEGYGRFHFLENAKFCSNSRGSCWEVLDHLITGNDDGLITTQLLEHGRDHVSRSVKLLNGYMNYLKRAHEREP
jgi:hypothetical protein